MRKTRFTLTCCLLLSTAAGAASYIAPIPPDAVILKGYDAHAGRQDIFLSKRAPEEIRAFYAAVADPARKTNEAESPTILSYQQVVDFLSARHGDLTLANELHVTVRWKPAANGQAACVGDFFRELYAISRMQHRDSEFDALCRQYGYVQNAFFQRVQDPKHPGRLIEADKIILARAHDQNGASQLAAVNNHAAETAAMISQLALNGQGEDAKTLATKFTEQSMQAAHGLTDWNAWVAVLKEGDAMAYRTLVVLPRHPNSW